MNDHICLGRFCECQQEKYIPNQDEYIEGDEDE